MVALTLMTSTDWSMYMSHRRLIVFSAVAASASILGLGLSLGLTPVTSAMPSSPDTRSPAQPTGVLPAGNTARSQVSDVIRLHVTSRTHVVKSGYELLAAESSQIAGSADINGCGSGFADAIFFPFVPGKYQEKTGFTGASPGAVAYTWSENIVLSHAGQVVKDYTVNQSGGLADRSAWTGQHTDTTTDTPADVTVSVNGSYVLANGTECFDAGSVTGYVP